MILEESSLWETGITLNYLERKSPYLEIIGESGRFDSCQELRHTQVKSAELIPEFYGEPSFLLGNKFRLPVILPKFSQDPFHFISLQRKLLEGEEVAAWLPKWLDSSFGIESRAIEVSRTAVSESTFQLTHQENQEFRHIRLFMEAHSKRKAKDESRRKSLFENNQVWNFYEQDSDLSNGKVLFLSSSQASNKIAVVSERSLIIYESVLQTKRDQYQAVQGLYVDQEISLSEEVMSQTSNPFEMVWSKMILLAIHKKSAGLLAIIDIKTDSCRTLQLSTSSIISLKSTYDPAKVLAGTNSGLCLVVDFSKSHPEVISKISLGTLPLIHKVRIGLI